MTFTATAGTETWEVRAGSLAAARELAHVEGLRRGYGVYAVTVRPADEE
jgi:hypothetical protein